MARRDRPSPVVLAAWESFLRTHLALTRRLDRELVERHELPLDWYDVLVQLHDAGGEATMGDLAARLLISPSTCTRVVGRMAAAGLVQRRVDAVDARVRHAEITREGDARLRAAAITHLAGIQRHFGRFVPDDEAVTLRDRFEAIRGSAVAD
ncbi:MAG TPA: MarR family winged helix-turn-helix transcriptional regulator [Ilumatobacter sp.]|nr:MarR family winged helix-turn-helix transcriptional regulator [Ilumatobacter sp.]